MWKRDVHVQHNRDRNSYPESVGERPGKFYSQKGFKLDMDNKRGIFMMNAISKVCDKILLNKTMKS